MPTKIDVSEPLIVFLSTSRPHLSPPNGNVALRSSMGAVASFFAPLPPRISAMMSAKGSTDFSSSAGAAGTSDGALPAFNCAITSPIGSTICDLYSDAVGGTAAGSAGEASVPASTSAAQNEVRVYVEPVSCDPALPIKPKPERSLIDQRTPT